MKEIKENLQQHTETVIRKIRERAEKIRDREISFAKKKYEELVQEGKNKVDRNIEIKEDSLRAQLILQFKLKEENFKYKLAKDLLREAKQKIVSLNEDVGKVSLKNLIREGIVSLDLKKAHILVNKKDEGVLKENYEEVVVFIKEKISEFQGFTVEGSLNCWGGVIVKSPSSPEFFDNTFERRFERFDREFKKKILEILG